MAIILAIEPDRKQAAHLSAVVRHRVGAELILADTTEAALDAIGSRVPDLVLVPALLSPQDDAALAAALRVIAVAAHVRTLTTPVFASTRGSSGGGGLFSRFRAGKTETSSVGCDPAVFAEQICDYLREAAGERAEREADSDVNQPFAEEPVVAAPPVLDPAPTPTPTPPPAAPVVRERELFASFNDRRPFEPEPEPEIAAQVAEPAIEPAPVPSPMPAPAPAIMTAPEAFAFVETANEIFAKPERRPEPIVEEEDSDDLIVIDLSDDIVEISPETVQAESAEPGDERELFDGERTGVYTMPMSLEEPLDTQLNTQLDDVMKIEKVERIKKIDKKPIDLDRIWLGLRHTRQWPVLEGVAVESATLNDFVAAPMDTLSPKEDGAAMRTSVVTPQPSHRADHLDWSELVASLRQDIERRRHQPGAATASARPTPAPRPITNPAAPSALQSQRKSGPIQDEWGFFDPQQCGFAALLEKLDEFSDPKAPKAS